MQAINLDVWWLVLPVGILAAILVVVLTLGFNLQRYVIIALTAIAGANALVLSVLTLFGQGNAGRGPTRWRRHSARPSRWLVLGCLHGRLLAIVGVVYQVVSTRITYFPPDDYVMYYT